MPTLICDLRPEAAEWIHEYQVLREAGEAVLLYWPSAPVGGEANAAVPMDIVVSPAGLDGAYENERLARLFGSQLPDWLPWDDFHRVLLCSRSGDELNPEETALASRLFELGVEEIEVISGDAARELGQSWHSGRRTGARRLRADMVSDRASTSADNQE